MRELYPERSLEQAYNLVNPSFTLPELQAAVLGITTRAGSSFAAVFPTVGSEALARRLCHSEAEAPLINICIFYENICRIRRLMAGLEDPDCVKSKLNA